MNVDAQTRGLPQIAITLQSNAVMVHAWGSCVPTYCDWGIVQATESADGALHAIWNFGFETTTLTLTMSSNGQLVSGAHTHFTDGSGRADSDFVDVFNKAS
ncbi:MAG TPA: hypothetical protein VLT86_11900 [Vicinamibacterales bacterium]|nr:hypothetical protein [Vicinamibacterales bacterium]